jgi:calcineurin-like phosphoesterase family protein
MADFWIADTHFGHDNILAHNNRPWKTIDENDDGLIANWNSVVNRKDTVRVIGDFAWGNHSNYLKMLQGNKILYIGSHDNMSVDSYRGFQDVISAGMVKINGEFFFCSHCPHRIWDRGHYGVPHLFGHHHGRLETWNLSFDIGVDTRLSNYFPIPHEKIVEEVERRRIMMDGAGRLRRETKADGKVKILYQQDDVMYWKNKSPQSMSKRICEMQTRFLPDNYITKGDGKFLCWDETKSEVVAVKDSIEDARMALHEYACTLEPVDIDTEL